MGAGYVTRVRWHCGQERDRQSLRCLQGLAAGTQAWSSCPQPCFMGFAPGVFLAAQHAQRWCCFGGALAAHLRLRANVG